MRTFVNCLKFKIAPILFSVILALSLPLTSLRSNAASIGVTSYAAGYMLYTIYRTALGILGVSSDDYNLPDPSNFTEDVFDALISPVRSGLNSYHPYLGDYFVDQIKAAYGTGKIMFEYSKLRLIKQFFGTLSSDDSVASAIGSSVTVASATTEYDLNSADYTSRIVINYKRTDADLFYTDTCYITSSSPYFVCSYLNDTSSLYIYSYLVFQTGAGNVSTSVETNNPSGALLSGSVSNYSFITSDGIFYSVRTSNPYFLLRNNYHTYEVTSASVYSEESAPSFDSRQVAADIGYNVVTNGVASFDDISSGTVVDNSSDVLSSTTDITSDGSVSGFLSVPVLKQTIAEAFLSALRSGGLTYDDFLNAFGAKSISVDATPAEKVEAQDSVTYPTDSVLTDSEAGSSVLDNVRNEVSSLEETESTLTDQLEDTLDDGSGNNDDEDNKKVPYWPLWRFPDWSDDPGGTDDDSGDPARLPEIVASVAIIGSLLEDFFDASGGASGFGFIYIVGVSFVLFSVLIGAAHFFGSFGSRSDVRETRSNNRKASAERLLYWQNKNRK